MVEGISARDVITGLLGVIVTILSWIGNRLHTRVDDLERLKANSDDMKEAIKELKADIKQALDTQTKLLITLLRGKLDD